MKPVVSMAVSMLVLAIAGSSTYAMAQTKLVKPQAASEITSLTPLITPVGDSYISEENTGFTKPQSKVYQFNLDGKWGVKFDVNQPETAQSGLNDIDAGAFYKLTPSVRVGGTVGFGEKSDPLKPESRRLSQDKKQPRVRLETTFKF
ncbi:NtrZ family periplasmic regulatory protein [Asticcacaulis sp. MM231]|uniref:NtrZ family periplasmic regulatory protein n=1 Tax=Asticcacaulis sp. MM231 TaxID=3157666 RepID=UPI0032D56B4F